MSDNEKRQENADSQNDAKDQERLPYPRSTIFILLTKFFERFAFIGTQTILIMYLTIQLAYTPDQATIIYHVFKIVLFCTPILGAIISDNWLGKYRTVLTMSVANVVGLIVMFLGSLDMLHLPARAFTIIALILIAIGTGGLKPCMLAFGGDQFQLPQQEQQMSRFYSWYMIIMLTSYMCAAAVAPVMRHDVQCFGNGHCFPLSFGVSCVVFVMALAVLLICRRRFIKRPVLDNVLFKVCMCIWHAARERFTSRKNAEATKPHWLDHAGSRYGLELVADVKRLFSMLTLSLSLPVIHALSEQLGSRWTIQASRMNGDLGFYNIKPDQLPMVMPLLVLILLNLWDWLVQPLYERFGCRLQMKFVLAGVLAAISFIMAGGLELILEPTYAVMPSLNECQVRIFNGHACDYRLHIADEVETIRAFDVYQGVIPLEGDELFHARLETITEECTDLNVPMKLTGGQALSYFLDMDNAVTEYMDNPKKDMSGKATLRLLVSGVVDQMLRIVNADTDIEILKHWSNSTAPMLLLNGRYSIISETSQDMITDVTLEYAGVYTLMLLIQPELTSTNLIKISPPSTISMLWMLPQYMVMAMAEALFNTTVMYFTYREAPTSMKAVMQAFMLLMISIGNLIDVIIVSAAFFSSQASEFFLFAGLMGADCVLIWWLANRYKSVQDDKQK